MKHRAFSLLDHGSEKKSYRSREDRKIAGVCGGLGKHLNNDPRLLHWAFD